MYGKSAIKGKKWEDFRSNESIAASKKILNEGLFKNYKHSEKSKNKISISSSGINNGFYGKKHNKKTKDNLRKKSLEKLKIKSESSIELIFESYLKELNINYKKQEILGFWSFDFYLPDHDIYIECDGDYWHANPLFYSNKNKTYSQKKNIANDKRKNKFMINYKLLRFWENDIINNKKYIIKTIKKFI
jgi:very-short-patch-repair endonuclease